jgi:hypothetical protein
MALLPEFFMLLGIVIFLAISLLSALLADELASKAQYFFQGGALLGLGELFISRSFVGSGVFSADPADPTRLWVSIVYLSSAIFTVLWINIYLGIIKRKTALATTFAGAVTVPVMMDSAFFVTSFLTTRGNVTITPGAISLLVIAALVSALSIIALLRQATKHTAASQVATSEPPLPPSPDMGVLTSAKEAPTPPIAPPSFSPLRLRTKREDVWEESHPEEGKEGSEN